MFAIAWLFFNAVFAPYITPELQAEYLAGAVLLGAPCTAMVKSKGKQWFNEEFLPKFGPVTVVGVLVEVPLMLALVRIANGTKEYFPA